MIEMEYPIHFLRHTWICIVASTNAVGKVQELAAHSVICEGLEPIPSPQTRPLFLQLCPVQDKGHEGRAVDLACFADCSSIALRIIKVKEEVCKTSHPVPFDPH